MSKLVIIALLLCYTSIETGTAAGRKIPDIVPRFLSSLADGAQRAYAKGSAFIVASAACVTLLSCGATDNNYLTYSDNAVSGEVVDGLPIMQGVTTENETQVFALTERSKVYLFSLTDGKNIIFPSVMNKRNYQGSAQEMQQLLFKGLSPGSTYLLQVHSARTKELLDERQLRTLTPDRHNIRFAFGSCMNDSWPQGDIWQQMVALNPDVIFLIGDNVYTDFSKDVTTPDDLWIRNFQTRNRIKLFKNKKLVPVVAVWDDHDYGMNNSDHSYLYKEESLSVFKTFFASADTDNFRMPGIGVASSFSIYGYNFFFLDNRTFRTAKDSSPQWHFGEMQLQWLWENLASKDTAFLVSGGQFFGGYSHGESFQGNHPERFSDFLSELKDSSAKVIFLSGDVHFTEIMEIPEELLGYQTYELTSSPIHAAARPFAFFPKNPLRIEGKGSVINFMLVEVSKSNEELHLKATSYTGGGVVLFSGEYTID